MEELRLLTILLIIISGCVAEQSGTEAFFCPEDGCEERTIAAINNAQESIDVAMYSFTSGKLANALIEAKSNGVTPVRVVIDYLQSSSRYSQKQNLIENGVDVRVMVFGKTMHNKFVIIDKETVLTGSYNWSKNGNEKNDENLLFVFDKETASLYDEEFFELWVEAG